MNFDEHPILFLFFMVMGITWIVFPFVVMHRLKKIQQHMDRAEGRAIMAYEQPPQPVYQEDPQPQPEQTA